MAKQGPEAKLLDKMRKTAKAAYGERLLITKQHGGSFSEVGVSDLLGCLDGTFFACEVKSPVNYGNSIERAVQTGATVKQIAYLERVAAAGGVAMVCASVEGFMRFLAEIAEP